MDEGVKLWETGLRFIKWEHGSSVCKTSGAQPACRLQRPKKCRRLQRPKKCRRFRLVFFNQKKLFISYKVHYVCSETLAGLRSHAHEIEGAPEHARGKEERSSHGGFCGQEGSRGAGVLPG